jgi:hypothetical protein
MPRMTKEERREKKLDRIRSYDERMKSKRIARQEKKKAKSVRKADRKVKRLEDKLEMTTARSGKADTIYQRQLDREAAKDEKKGRGKGRTTRLRRKRAKKASSATSTALAALATKNVAALPKANYYTTKQALKKVVLPMAKAAGQTVASAATASDPYKYDIPEDRPTIYEPRMMRKALLRKKKARVEKKLAGAKKKREKAKASKGVWRYDN